ncbi:MAG: hypothetical protein HRU19_14480 [Pseudobacteriovorax sp.]|nr:hypothetical protein [Pseudobacteriovorax sp.]
MNMVSALNFPARNGCGFGEGDNLEARDAYLQARTVESVTVDLPDNAVVCDVNINSQSSELQYDDFLFFTLNDTILVGSNDVLLQDFPYENQLYSWNWDEVKGLPIAQFDTAAYCLPDSNCIIPGHDSKGAFSLSFQSANENFAQIAVELFEKKQATFKLISTGDNDEGDCEHTDFNLDLNVEYVIPN